MAISWIKVEVITPEKPEVMAIAKKLKEEDVDFVTGKLIRLWAWADQHSVTGKDLKISCSNIDRIVFCKGFAKALISVGWLKKKGRFLEFVNFERHNGATAKARAESARRMAKSRAVRGELNHSFMAGYGGKGVADDAALFLQCYPFPSSEDFDRSAERR